MSAWGTYWFQNHLQNWNSSLLMLYQFDITWYHQFSKFSGSNKSWRCFNRRPWKSCYFVASNITACGASLLHHDFLWPRLDASGQLLGHREMLENEPKCHMSSKHMQKMLPFETHVLVDGSINSRQIMVKIRSVFGVSGPGAFGKHVRATAALACSGALTAEASGAAELGKSSRGRKKDGKVWRWVKSMWNWRHTIEETNMSNMSKAGETRNPFSKI